MDGQPALIAFISVLFVLTGVCGECIYNDNENLLNMLFKKQDKLQEKVQEIELEHAAKIKDLELAAMKEKLHWQEEMNKLKTERFEERLSLFDYKIPDNLNFNLSNASALPSVILSVLGSAFNKLLNIEEGEFTTSQERITEQLSRLIATSIPSSERDVSHDNDAIRNLNNKLNEIQTAVDTLQGKVEDLAATDIDNEQEVLLSNTTITPHKGLVQIRIMVQGLQEKVNELTASRHQLEQTGRDRDNSSGLQIGNDNHTYFAKPRYCHDYYIQGERRDGVFTIYPGWNGTRSARVWCEFDVGAEVGWTIIIARMPTENPVNFSRGWDDYKTGFGEAGGEYWIGLSLLHEISVSHCSQVLQVNLHSWDQTSRHAQYKDFSVGDEESGYKLTVGGYSGDAVDAMAYHNGKKFTTIDKDNDASGSNCAVGGNRGGFWYSGCYHTNPFGVLRKKGDGEGMRWNKWLSAVNLKKITYKITPRLPQFV